MSFRPLITPVSIAVWAMAFALAGCGSQATNPVRFSKVMVRPGDGTTIQLLADMCQGQPYKTVVEESADLVSIQLLGTVPDGNTRLSCADLVGVKLPRLCHHDECTTRRLAQTSQCRALSNSPNHRSSATEAGFGARAECPLYAAYSARLRRSCAPATGRSFVQAAGASTGKRSCSAKTRLATKMALSALGKPQ